jgi:flagellar protein FlbD
MIKLTRLDGTEFYMNPDLIECVEETPDTVITLTNDDHFLVREKAKTITDRIISFKAMIIRRSSTLTKPYHLKRRLENNSRCIRHVEE